MESLIKLDEILFKTINSKWIHPLLDIFFPFWTDFQKMYFFKFFVFPILLFLLFKKYKWAGVCIALVGLVFANVFDVAINSIKPFFARPRPMNSNLPFEVILRGPAPGGFSFPSGHAADAFFIAVFLSTFIPQGRWIFLVLAFLTAYSRIYCGIHYPLDALAGGAIGAASGFITAVLVSRAVLALLKKRRLF